MTDLRDRAVALYDAYTHEHLDRRRLLREMTLLAGSAVAAEALIGGIGASAASAAPASRPPATSWHRPSGASSPPESNSACTGQPIQEVLETRSSTPVSRRK